MSASRDFLVEIGTEELPPKSLLQLSAAFADGIEKGLQGLGCRQVGRAVRDAAAPRRARRSGSPSSSPTDRSRSAARR